MKRILLLFPPQFEPTQPYSSLPCLTAALRKAKVEVIQRDINLESFQFLLSPEFIQNCRRRIEEKVFEFETRPYLELGEQADYANALKASVSADYICKNILEAVDIFRDRDRFRVFQQYSYAHSVIQCALKIVSAAYYPSHIDLYETRIGANPVSSDDAFTAALDSEINPYVEWLEKDIIPGLAELAPDVIGVSIVCPDQFVPALSLARMLKKKLQQAFMVFGGAFITRTINNLSNPKRFFSYVDGVIAGEGETSICELVDRLDRSVDVVGTKNLIVFRDGHLVRGEEHLESFMDLPLPDFSDLPLDKYLSPELILPYQASRGCYYAKCTFCSHFYPFTKYKEIPPGSAYASILELSLRHNTRYFSFSDEALRPIWMQQFSECVAGSNAGLAWFTFARFEDDLQRSTLEAMRNGGCKMLMFGLESADDRVLAIMDKGTSMPVMKRVIGDCADLGIAIRLGVLIGFPGEMMKESLATLNFFEENLNILDKPFFAPPISRFKLLKNSIIDRDPARFGVTILEHSPDEDLDREQYYLVDQGMTMAEAEQQYRVFTRFFIDNLKAYKKMPDNKAHSFLYKCLADEGLIIPEKSSPRSPSEQRVISSGEWTARMRFAPTVVDLDAVFNLERIHRNVKWLEQESEIRRLREARSLYEIRRELINNGTDRTVYAEYKTYLFDILTLGSVEIDDSARWLARNINKFSSWPDIQTEFTRYHGWAPELGNIIQILKQLELEGLLIINGADPGQVGIEKMAGNAPFKTPSVEVVRRQGPSSHGIKNCEPTHR